MINIVIPAAGRGIRFFEKGYVMPKPFIQLPNKQSMLEHVTQNLGLPNSQVRWILLEEQVGHLPRSHPPVSTVHNVTQGTACTILSIKGQINNSDPLIVANSDQIIDGGILDFYQAVSGYDGGILCFAATDPKWSFVRIGKDGFVKEVAEKLPISNIANCGVYYWAHGSDFVLAAEKMIRSDIRVNNEYYLAPTYNELILAGRKIKAHVIDKNRMHGLGTPEDFNTYVTNQ